MAKKYLKVATCQFAVGSSIKVNARQIRNFIEKAAKTKADIVHFPECALSGYAGTDFKSFAGYDWELLRKETLEIMSLAKKLHIWVVLGSSHQLTEPNNPHNSLYLINPSGKIVDRYDKRFCTPGDLKHYTPGNRFVNFVINGVKCSLLICYELRFPELYRELYKQSINCIFQSFYNARAKKPPCIWTHIMRQTMQCRAATNYFWVSMTNPSGYYSPYPSCFITPDGKIEKQLRQNKPGIMTNTVDLNKQYYDASKYFRDMAIAGRLDNRPKNLNDPRSKNTTTL